MCGAGREGSVMLADSYTWAMSVSGSDVAWTDYAKIAPLGGAVHAPPKCNSDPRCRGQIGS
ncbi:hypothetical protein HYPSUDRAFT_45498 [Hypholoma sublateritium FD-334 SS-4]|uniref:Uncharacterized protein n=1 Tax=Hypholoma sublateritium (strain FD-334 SS-4) TaxID=945553 RepID=A0A0D2NN79_HYPSF|nr:hypothetical protein HYPSUDRAFT_45498 [Hypholoma sublateritium FD-334 SS-4]